MLAAFLLYAILLVYSIKVGRHMPRDLPRTLILVSPMLPFLLVVWAIVCQIRRADEYIRVQTFENVVIAAAVPAGWTSTYGFLENAGFPRIRMFTVCPVMGFVWGILAIVRCAVGR